MKSKVYLSITVIPVVTGPDGPRVSAGVANAALRPCSFKYDFLDLFLAQWCINMLENIVCSWYLSIKKLQVCQTKPTTKTNPCRCQVGVFLPSKSNNLYFWHCGGC